MRKCYSWFSDKIKMQASSDIRRKQYMKVQHLLASGAYLDDGLTLLVFKFFEKKLQNDRGVGLAHKYIVKPNGTY